jgi:hypothetical protein
LGAPYPLDAPFPLKTALLVDAVFPFEAVLFIETLLPFDTALLLEEAPPLEAVLFLEAALFLEDLALTTRTPPFFTVRLPVEGAPALPVSDMYSLR